MGRLTKLGQKLVAPVFFFDPIKRCFYIWIAPFKVVYLHTHTHTHTLTHTQTDAGTLYSVDYFNEVYFILVKIVEPNHTKN